jgi:transposase-like protein
MREMSVTEQRYKAVLAVIGEGRTVSEVAKDWGISRRTMHRLAGALRRRSLSPRSRCSSTAYGSGSPAWRRSKNLRTLEALVGEFVAIARWLHISTDQRSRCQASDDVFDALVAACVSRAAAIGLVRSIPDEEADAAGREGWISLPTKDSLNQLGGPSEAK